MTGQSIPTKNPELQLWVFHLRCAMYILALFNDIIYFIFLFVKHSFLLGLMPVYSSLGKLSTVPLEIPYCNSVEIPSTNRFETFQKHLAISPERAFDTPPSESKGILASTTAVITTAFRRKQFSHDVRKRD